MRLPQLTDSKETYAYVEMQLRAVLQPQHGFFGLTAILSDASYVITPACHITGGFAFFLWFGTNPNSGQFVVTLGGYHPAFKPPDYYPQVPRLGFNWAVSDEVSMKGDAYFALTPSCIMAGGGLEILYHSGDLRAWFTAQADFLVAWRPFFYTAHIDVSIGVSYNLDLLFCHKTISISLGATVDMWGPPTGGTAKIHVVIVDVTVHFGSENAGAQDTPLTWDGFQGLLPSAGSVVRINISDGLYTSQDSDKSGSGKRWVVRATDFQFFTQSAIPASHLQYGDTAKNAESVSGHPATDYTDPVPSIDIKPMNHAGVKSTHTLKIFKEGHLHEDLSGWSLKSRTQNVPESLWGARRRRRRRSHTSPPNPMPTH